MSNSKSPEEGAGDFHFSSDDDVRRPRRAAPQRNAFVEEGTDSDSDASGPSNKRKSKKTKTKKAPPAKKAKLGAESDSDDEKDSKMQHLTEKERELEIFRHIEQQELMKTRKQIQQKLLGADGSDDEKPEKSKKEQTEKESGEESSSSSKDEAKKDHSEESEIDMDTEFHRPSDVAKKIEKKQAIAELVRSRKEKRLQEEKRKETLDVDKVFGASSDSDESSSSDSSGSESDSDDDRRRSSPDTVKGEPVSFCTCE
uniref:Uncharacterized protein n=1 Tax=Panagrolaimus sp. JU765 TaxID=591449 RepID=A0AC34R862_9BILA